LPREGKEALVHKLTVGLLSTYRKVNEDYYDKDKKKKHAAAELMHQQAQLQQQQQTPNRPGSRDDADFDYIVRCDFSPVSSPNSHSRKGAPGGGDCGRVCHDPKEALPTEQEDWQGQFWPGRVRGGGGLSGPRGD
jgi:hypothetical protein